MKNVESSLQSRLSRWRRSLSLREKLTYLISGVSLLVVSTSMLLSLCIEIYFFRNRLMEEYTATARMVGSNLEAAIVFEDARDSKDILGKLDRYVNVEAAGLYLEDGSLLAEYVKDDGDYVDSHLLGPEIVSHMDYRHIVVNEPILDSSGQVTGSIVLNANLGEMYAYAYARLWVFILLLLMAILFAVLLARRLGQVVSMPIVDLTKTANRIAKEHDLTVRPVRRSDDEIGQLVDAFNEMMTQVNTRDELIRSSEKRFRDYFDLGVVGAGVLDTKFRWIEANGRILEMLQSSLLSLQGACLWDLLPEGELGLTLEQFSRTTTDGSDRVATREFWLKQGESNYAYFLISMRYVPSTKYLADHIIFMAQDITNRKRYEEAILLAKEEAEASSRSKDEFLSVISHELRTPLNPIIGYVDLMIQERDDVQDPRRLFLVKKSAEHLLELIDDVLDYSRIERGVLSFSEEPVNYRAICDNAIELMVRDAKGKGLELKSEHRVDPKFKFPEASIILIDRVKLRQVVLNLVSNALKFTIKGSILLSTELFENHEGKFSLRVSVKDTGIGIDRDDFHRVFKTFSQIDSSLTRRHSGMGLGLAISKKIVEAFGGNLGFESEKNVGSDFWFEIPVQFGAPSKEVESTELKKKTQKLEDSNLPILLVEDEPINLELAKSLLVRADQEVVCARDGQEAVEKARELRFSLIIMDVRMPRMDGLEATREIRKMEVGTDRTPIVAVSANATNQDKIDCFDAGMDDYLPKPLNIQKLNTLIEDWL